jgi:hypothetical protein
LKQKGSQIESERRNAHGLKLARLRSRAFKLKKEG